MNVWIKRVFIVWLILTLTIIFAVLHQIFQNGGFCNG
jgi:hypothetical protein